jgi:16S rRNA G966 N2-methylase RsmD
VIAGNQRLKIHKERGDTEVEVKVPDRELSLEEIKEIGIKSNRHSGEWDMDILANEFEDLLQDLGYDDLLPEVELEVKEDDYEEPEDLETTVVLGDVYQLGNHRLMCGDSTKIEDVEKLMNGDKADMVFTDPPYNLGYEYKTYKDDKTGDEYRDFCTNWFNILKIVSNQNIIITTGKQNMGMWFGIADPEEVAVWIHKNGVSGGRVSNLSLYEPIFFYGKYDRNSRPSNLFEYELKRQDTGKTGKEHSCPKQLDLIGDIVKNYSQGGDLLLDVFGGSGTTLIACEQTNRRCYMMELDPHYCQVIIDRWEKLTGNKSIKL